MDRETVIRLAREAGASIFLSPYYMSYLERFAAAVEANCVPQWVSVEDRLPEIPEGEKCSVEVLAGFWYKDTWLIEEKQDQFSYGICRMLKNDNLKEFPEGKQWHTHGPSHNQITHWMQLPSAPAPKDES